jgi:hypothetical protein
MISSCRLDVYLHASTTVIDVDLTKEQVLSDGTIRASHAYHSLSCSPSVAADLVALLRVFIDDLGGSIIIHTLLGTQV